MKESNSSQSLLCIGIDLGDSEAFTAVLESSTGEVLEESRIKMTQKAFIQYFEGREPCRIAIEAGAHSPWVDRLLSDLGHEVIVANPYKVSLITRNDSKSDRVDALLLAQLAAANTRLLFPIKHRSADTQADRAVLKARDQLVRCRTQLINCSRGLVKAFGFRLPTCSAAVFHKKVREGVPDELHPAIDPLLDSLAAMQEQIQLHDKRIEELGDKYEITKRLQEVNGIGPITSLNFVLTIEDPSRFQRSREVGSYVGLRPGNRSSGKSNPEMHITKAGDPMLRKHLVNSAQHILGPFGKDCDTRHWGLKLASRGDKAAKKRAVVAVARKLCVLLHALWRTGADYEPLRNTKRRAKRLKAPSPEPPSGARAPAKVKRASKKRNKAKAM